MESCIQLKEVQEDGDNDDDDGAEDLDDDDEDEDTEDDDEVIEWRHCFLSFLVMLKHTAYKIKNTAIRIRTMMMCEKKQKRNSLKDMH
jgi:hypothetical protein